MNTSFQFSSSIEGFLLFITRPFVSVLIVSIDARQAKMP